MWRVARAAILTIATALGALSPALAQGPGGGGNNPVPTSIVTRGTITPLGWYAMGTVFCAAAAPIIGTAVLGREMTANEVGRSTLTCFLGPVGWALGDVLFPLETARRIPPRPPGQPGTPSGRGRNANIPPAGETRFVPDEVLIEVRAGSVRALAALARRLQLTQLETQSFALTGRTLQRWRVGGNRTVAATLRALAASNVIAAAQPNWLYGLAQSAAPQTQDTGAQYVVSKLRLLEAHRITGGDDVLVAVIDSRIDGGHPDLAGVIAEEFDALGGASKPHAHGTAMASAIAARSKLLGVAPKVRLLAVRSFAGDGDSAQGTTFDILKGVDWAAGRGARVINMSFAGPADVMLRDMLGKAHRRGIVLVAAVGNAGPKSPPLYPAANANVIGVTATDAQDRLLPQANRGPQVAVAAPGVDILAASPDGQYQVTSGTSVAAAHASGVAALLLARDNRLTPVTLRRILVKSAQPATGKPTEVGAGVIDAYGAVNSLSR